MSEAEKTVKYLVCDGCGYAISAKTDPYLVLTIREPRVDAVDLHFHATEKEDEKRSWGTRDCLHYWVTSRVAHGHSRGWDGRGPRDGDKYLRDVMKASS